MIRPVRCLGKITKAAQTRGDARGFLVTTIAGTQSSRSGGEEHGELLGHHKRGHKKMHDDTIGSLIGCDNAKTHDLEAKRTASFLFTTSADT